MMVKVEIAQEQGMSAGKQSRFFQQREGLHGQAGTASLVVPPATAVQPLAKPPPVGATAGMVTDDMDERGKRKRTSDGGAGSGKVTRVLEDLLKQAMDRQKAMQQQFVEAIEKREAWRRQEMAQERAMAATGESTGKSVPIPSIAGHPIRFMPPPPRIHATPVAYTAAPAPSSQPSASTQNPPTMPLTLGSGGGGRASSSPRWTKEEVDALIQLHSNLHMRRKGSLWEEISAGMRGMGYSRSSKQCIRKWGDMNYYFKKVKDINKNRPEDSKCPSYFHQLEALYRNKQQQGQMPPETPAGGGGGASSVPSPRWTEAEVDALFQMRSKNLDMRRKGSLWDWEEISAGMLRMGYSRSSKECMYKWWNMNYYFNKMKDSNQLQAWPSYFHQLQALGSPAGASGTATVHTNAAPLPPIRQTALQPHTLPPVAKNDVTNNDGNRHDAGGVSGGTQMQATNGGNRFVISDLNDLPALPVRSSTISAGATSGGVPQGVH